jgi:hypothetical protein
MLLAVLGTIAVTLAIVPYTWSGGGGPPGNRYFMATYPVLFFFLPPVRSLAVPLVALVYFRFKRYKLALAIGAAILLLTQLIYPVLYVELLGLENLPLGLLTLRNLLLVVLLVWANIQLSKKAELVTN